MNSRVVLTRSAYLALAAFGLAVPATFWARPSGAHGGAAPPSAAASPAGPSSAIGKIVGRLVAETGTGAKGALIIVAPVRSDEPALRADDLGAKLAALMANGLGGGASVRPERTSLAMALALARNAPLLLYLQAEIASGELRVNADAYQTTRNVWDRARRPVPVSLVHGFATARIDGEVRSYLAPVPLVISRIDRASTEDKDILALACGDVDDDGTLEILTLSRRQVALGRARGGRFVVLRTASLRDVAGIAPIPMREPVGGMVILPGHGTRASHLDVGITDRARGGRLDADLRLVQTIAGVPVATPSGDACAQFQGSTLAASFVKCAEVDPAIDSLDIEVPLDATAVASFVLPDGLARIVQASRDPRTSELRLREGGRRTILAHAGAQVALGDLDQDGAPEVISTLDTLPKAASERAEDALVMTTWQADGTLRERSRTPVPAGITAVAACPPEGGGLAPVLVATSGELWILR